MRLVARVRTAVRGRAMLERRGAGPSNAWQNITCLLQIRIVPSLGCLVRISAIVLSASYSHFSCISEKNPGATNDERVGHQLFLGSLEPLVKNSEFSSHQCFFVVFLATSSSNLSFEPPLEKHNYHHSSAEISGGKEEHLRLCKFC